MKRITILIGLIVVVIGGYVLLSSPKQSPSFSKPAFQQEVVAQNLDTPWGIAFLPDNNMLVTERPGRVRIGQEVIADLAQVKEIGEGGLLGIAIDPDFAKNNFVYFYYTYSESGGNTLNRVVRMVYEDKKLQDETIIVDKIPGASNHNGGRIKFGPDGFLYISTGDAQNPSLSQDINSLAGKILRIKNGNVEVYSLGHRNPQGLAWDNIGRLWETEHGPSAHDEINMIEQGKNYGWPDSTGDPVLESGLNTWAPSGVAFLNNSLFFGGLRGEALFEYNIQDKSLKELFKGEFGRIRDVVLGPDNMLYISTSNQDGRGTPRQGDDKIIRINPQML